MSDLSNDTKKHTMKSRETIPLSVQYSTVQFLCNQDVITYIYFSRVKTNVTLFF
jgi:hypothetical protein